MNKSVIMVMMTVGSVIGGGLPYLLGDVDLLSLWPIVGGLVGGILGVLAGAKLSQAMS